MAIVTNHNSRSTIPPRSRKGRSPVNRIKASYGAAGIAILLGIWFGLTEFGLVNTFLLPTPGDVVRAGIDLAATGELWNDTRASLVRVLAGFLIALVVAVPLGIAMGLTRPIMYFFSPLVELIRPIPPIAVIPLAMLWFGIGEESKIFLIAYGAFFPILLNTLGGMTSIEETHTQAVLTLGATRAQSIRHVVLPSAFPQIVVGARLGIAMGFIVLVAAELLAADSGLGFLIQDARQRFATDVVFVGIIVIGILGLGLNQIMLRLERLAVPWRYIDGR